MKPEFALFSIFFFLGFFPLLSGPGYELSLVCGLVVPSVTAGIIALREQKNVNPFEETRNAFFSGLRIAFACWMGSSIHLLRTKPCDPFSGTLFFFEAGGFGVVMGALWGRISKELSAPLLKSLLEGRFSQTPISLGVKFIFAVSLPVFFIFWSLKRFYSTPCIFAYDTFAGYFSGTLYDTVIKPGPTLHWFRFGSLLWVIFIFACSALCDRNDRGTLSLKKIKRDNAFFFMGLTSTLLFGCIIHFFMSQKLGFFHDSEYIEHELSLKLEGKRCIALFPSSTQPKNAELLLRDCEENIRRVERKLETVGASKIKAFFFRDAAQKKKMMGAEYTYIAKPWRSEVYLQLSSYPHPVLGHELAHVIAGAFASGPFKVAGSLGGYLPNPGLIEGLASFASPQTSDLTDREWAEVMFDMNLLPPIHLIFSLRFFGVASAKAYTLAGAFVTYVAETYGVATVREWYRHGDIETLVSKPWVKLESDFVSWLKKQKEDVDQVKDGTMYSAYNARRYAEAAFKKPALFARTCGHVVDDKKQEAENCLAQRRYKEAQAFYEEALKLDPRDPSLHLQKADAFLRQGKIAEATHLFEKLSEDSTLPDLFRLRAEEKLADQFLIFGGSKMRKEEARKKYEKIFDQTLDDDQRRQLDLKMLACDEEIARKWLLPILFSKDPELNDQDADPFLLGLMFAGSEDLSPKMDALKNYLIGKQLRRAGRDMQAVSFFRKVLESRKEQLAYSILREAVKELVIAAKIIDDQSQLNWIRSLIEKREGENPFVDVAPGKLIFIRHLLEDVSFSP